MRKKLNAELKYLSRKWQMLLMVLPMVALYVIFRYIPMLKLVICFQDYNIFKGIHGSPWVGLYQFKRIFSGSDFGKVFGNTLIISLLKQLFGFPAPIILAIIINEAKGVRFKRICQNIYYLPHFLNWVVLAGVFSSLFALDGLVNDVIEFVGGERIFFYKDDHWFRFLLIFTSIYSSIGWGTIIYLAALAGVDVQLYEAASLDGASRWQQVKYITIPSILSTVLVCFVLGMAGILDAGQDQILAMQNDLVVSSSEIIDTYVYKRGLLKSEYSYSSAVGIFKSCISAILVVITEALRRKVDEL